MNRDSPGTDRRPGSLLGRKKRVLGLALGADSHPASPHTRLLLLGPDFPVAPDVCFSLNHSGLGNSNTRIMTNLSLWERKDATVNFRKHLGSSYKKFKTWVNFFMVKIIS